MTMSIGRFLRKILQKENSPSDPAPKPYFVKEAGVFTFGYCKNAYYQYLFEGNTTTQLNIPQKLVIETVVNNLKKKEQRANAIPRLPSVIPKLLRSLRDPMSSAKDYVAIINKDPVMSAAVLKLANSVYFNPAGAHVEEIDRAVVKLGIQGLRSVLSAAVMQPIIQRESPYFSQTGQRLWVHSLNCAVACEVIAKDRGLDRYKVYLMGLVHDIGKITLFSELCKQFKLNQTPEPPGHSAFAPTMKKISSHLSYIVACDWDLPEDICIALKQQIALNSEIEITAFAQLLCHANVACEMYAVTPKNERDALEPILKEFKLPINLWEILDAVDTQI